METRLEWSSRLRRLADESGVSTHQFLKRVESPTPQRRDMLLAWAEQDYFVSQAFPQLLGILISGISDPKIRHPLVVNLWEEHGEGNVERSHFSLFQQMLDSVGRQAVVPPEVQDPATHDLIKAQEELAAKNILGGLGAFCYGSEYITVTEFRPLWRAFVEEFGSSANVAYFVENSEVDEAHARETEDVIDSLVGVTDDLDQVEVGASLALSKRVTFYDRLLTRFPD